MWTDKTPTEPGFYFYHPPRAGERHVWVAQVTHVRDREKGLFCSLADFLKGPQVSHKPINTFKGKWSGPIPDPGPCN